MAIVKNNFRVPRLDGDLCPVPRASISGSDEDLGGEVRTTSSDSDGGASASETDTGGSASDAESGMGSDEYDLSELGEPRTEICQVGNQSCSIPLDLYDLPDLGSILSLETWNECLSEEDRFKLAEFLPDMDQETFGRTLKELFSGANFHFGSPLADLFGQLKAGLCDPRMVLYRRGVNFIQRRAYYHRLRKYQNSMVSGLVRIRDAFQNYVGYNIEEKLHLLNIIRSQMPRNYDRHRDVRGGTDSESGESVERLWNKRLEMARHMFPPKENAKSNLKVSDKVRQPLTIKQGMEKKIGPPMAIVGHPRDHAVGLDKGTSRRARNQVRVDDEDYDDQGYEMGDPPRGKKMLRTNLLKPKRRNEVPKKYEREVPVGFVEEDHEGYIGSSHDRGWGRDADQEVTVASYDHHSVGNLKEAKYSQRDRISTAKDRAQPQAMIGARPYKGFPVHSGDSYLQSNFGGKSSQEKISNKSAHNAGVALERSKGNTMLAQSEETESDSSDQDEGNGDSTPVRKMGYPSGSMDGHQMVVVKPVYDSRMVEKLAKLEKKVYPHLSDGGTSIDILGRVPYKKWNQKERTNELPSYLHDIKPMKKLQVPHPSEKSQMPSLKTYPTERKRKGIDMDHPFQQSKYMHGYGSGMLNENEESFESFDVKPKLADGQLQANKSGSRSQFFDSHISMAADREMSNIPLLGCNTMPKKRKSKMDAMFLDEQDESIQQFSPTKRSDDLDLLKKKAKKKADAGSGSLTVVTPEPVVSEKGMTDVEVETMGQNKPFTLITPTIHTGFSFSIIHLLSAVRKAMITPHVEDSMNIGNHLEKTDRKPDMTRDEQSKMLQAANIAHPSFRDIDNNTSELTGQNNLPSLTVQEIVDRVRSNPGDPCILEAQEPLQDLVRGVLKIFSSKTAPLGAKGWKALVLYEKLNKSWSWVGPVFCSSSETDTIEEETSSEAWGIPRKMLEKLVDVFANWLKCGQETLQQIGSLPAPPIVMLPDLDEKERFKDLRAQKSLKTISPSSDEVRAYFRKEEFLRYSVPDRAFSYTAADGKKSMVAPLRRGGGKPTSKARDHFMLKPDRPPHFTILCLVRDAAARLPGSIGTRADVCTLIRDSQYIVEDLSEAQVTHVVSGALDRLHYERDPCVQFDNERKLWSYLHRDREEEDFEDDGTSSTKKWKRPRKDAMDHSDMGTVNDLSYHVTEDPATVDLNVDSSSTFVSPKVELVYNGLSPNMENNQPYIASTHGERSRGHPVSWDGIGLNPSRENRMLCQENSTNEDFDDEAFRRERPAGLLGSRLF